jgi:hypothetical protein
MVRIISDLKSVYLLPPDYVKPKQMKDLTQIHDKIQKRYPEIYSGQADVGNVELKIDMGSYPTKLHPCIKGIIYNLEIGSDNVFYWIHKLCDLERKDWVHKKNKSKNKKIKKFEYKYKYLKIVWEILHLFIDRNSEYEFVREQIWALEAFYKKMTHKEKPIYLYHAVLLLVRRNEIDWTSTAPPVDTPIADVVKLYTDHFNHGRMKIDDYVLDLHTKKMKWSSQCLEKFALEGAYIKNENDNFLNQEYREIYILLKKELDLYHARGGKLQ